jgi:hypothetical protein
MSIFFTSHIAQHVITSANRVIEAKNSRSRVYDDPANRIRFPTYPYVIFYKNYQMVHDPIVSRPETFFVDKLHSSFC